MSDKEILNEIAEALESRGFVHCCNGEGIGKLCDSLEAAERRIKELTGHLDFIGWSSDGIAAAKLDAARLDWLDSRSFMAYRDRDPETGKLSGNATVVNEDHARRTKRRVGNVGKIRVAIDQAMKLDSEERIA